MFWNTALIITPCVIVYYMAKSKDLARFKRMKWGARFSLLVLFLIWLMFFPNTAYQFTIVRHLVNLCTDYNKYRVCAEESWQVMMFFTYACFGLPAFYYSLNKMGQVTTKVFGKIAGAALPYVIIPLTSIGMLLGLYQRYNSWNLLNKPQRILYAVSNYFTQTTPFLNWLFFTACLFIIYYASDYLIRRNLKLKI
jgi:uncharacterized membrane protein